MNSDLQGLISIKRQNTFLLCIFPIFFGSFIFKQLKKSNHGSQKTTELVYITAHRKLFCFCVMKSIYIPYGHRKKNQNCCSNTEIIFYSSQTAAFAFICKLWSPKNSDWFVILNSKNLLKWSIKKQKNLDMIGYQFTKSNKQINLIKPHTSLVWSFVYGSLTSTYVSKQKS